MAKTLSLLLLFLQLTFLIVFAEELNSLPQTYSPRYPPTYPPHHHHNSPSIAPSHIHTPLHPPHPAKPLTPHRPPAHSLFAHRLVPLAALLLMPLFAHRLVPLTTITHHPLLQPITITHHPPFLLIITTTTTTMTHHPIIALPLIPLITHLEVSLLLRDLLMSNHASMLEATASLVLQSFLVCLSPLLLISSKEK